MRLKNIKGSQDKVKSSPYLIIEPITYQGKYQTLFDNNNPINIEIGMGKGDFIINMAIKYPYINFIGIEKYASVLLKATEKLENLELKNLKLINMDATDINNVFNKEINTIYLNFSDPWPKKRHAKRRLTNEVFLHKYDIIFKDTKRIIMKTDNQNLFEYSVKTLNNYNYQINDISLNLHQTDLPNIETEYEQKFSSKGYPIYFIDVSKDN